MQKERSDIDISAKGPRRRIIKGIAMTKEQIDRKSSAQDKSLFVNQDRRGDLSHYHKKSEKSMRELAALKMEACEQERQMYDFAGIGNSSIASLQTK